MNDWQELTPEQIQELASQQQERETIARQGKVVDNDLPTAFIRADYQEWKPETFKGFVVDVDGTEHGPFISYEDALRFAYANADRVFNTSSIDHYKQDLARGMTH